jgi:hypothetical protein
MTISRKKEPGILAALAVACNPLVVTGGSPQTAATEPTSAIARAGLDSTDGKVKEEKVRRRQYHRPEQEGTA